MYAGLFSEWNSFYSDSTPIPYSVRIYPVYEFTPVYYIVDMGGFGHRVNSDSIRNGGAI